MIIKRSLPKSISFPLPLYLAALHTFSLEAATKPIGEDDNVPNHSSYEEAPSSSQTQGYKSLDTVDKSQSFNRSPKKRKRYLTPKKVIPILSIIVGFTTYSFWSSEDKNDFFITEDNSLEKVPKSKKETIEEDIQAKTEDDAQKQSLSYEEPEEESEEEQTPAYQFKLHDYHLSPMPPTPPITIDYSDLQNHRQKSLTLSPHANNNITKHNLTKENQVHTPQDSHLSVSSKHQESLNRSNSNPYLHASAPTYVSLKAPSENGSISEIPLKQADSPVDDEDIVITYENNKPVVQLQKDIRQKNKNNRAHQRRPTPKIQEKKSLKNRLKENREKLVNKVGNKINEMKENRKQKKQKEQEEKLAKEYEKINQKEIESLDNEITLV